MSNTEKERLIEEVLKKRRDVSSIYDESVKVMNSIDRELHDLMKSNDDKISSIPSSLNEEYMKELEKEISRDFNIAEEEKTEIVRGKESKEVFDEISSELKQKVLGEDKAVDSMILALRRPYVIGFDPAGVKNSIILSGPNGTGKHFMVKECATLLKKHNLITSSDVSTIDMSRYQTSAQETLFLQDLYRALNAHGEFVIIENFETSSSVYNRMLAELVLNGKIVLNKRYNLNNGHLEEVSTKLSSNIVDTLNANGKYLVFVTTLKTSKLMDYFGKQLLDKIVDKVATETLNEEAINKIITNLKTDLVVKCKTQLEIDLLVMDSFKDYIKSKYEPGNGADCIQAIIESVYSRIVDVCLNRVIETPVTLSYRDELMINIKEETIIFNDFNSNEERDAIQKELDEIVGLDEVKNYLLSLENHIKINKLRKQKGYKVAEVSKHMIFTGNPGTGKTTIARLVSRMMKACGVLEGGQLVEVTRSDLVGRYVGHTAPLTMSVIESAIGGVLFIDEAYSLYRGKDDSFGLEAIDTLVKMMEDHRDNLIVILAGYSKEMSEFLTANSGLKSRFANIINFEDYTGEELMKIAKSVAKSKDYKIDEEALVPIKEYFDAVQANADSTSGNGRLARNLVEEAILAQSRRLIDDPDADFETLLLEDFNLNKE